MQKHHASGRPNNERLSMYLLNDGYNYYRQGEQHRSRGKFLILMQCEHGVLQITQKEHCFSCKYYVVCGVKPGAACQIRAIVRKVALHQFGHFMMGSAQVKGVRIPISGSYGSDGLPRSVPPDIYMLGTPLPQELYEAWNNGGGHNGAGSEAGVMAKWAIDTLTQT